MSGLFVKRWSLLLAASLVAWVLMIALIKPAYAQGPECPPGFFWRASSGVGCMQEGCLNIANAKYSYTGACVCLEGHKACYEPVDYSSFDRDRCQAFCPVSTLLACVAPDGTCPGAEALSGSSQQDEAMRDEPDEPPAEDEQSGSAEEQELERGREESLDAETAAAEASASTIADLMRNLEERLAGKGARAPTPRQAAWAGTGVSVLMGAWVIVNLLSGSVGSPAALSSTAPSSKPPASPTTAPASSLSSPGRISFLEELYRDERKYFRQCQDMPWAYLTKKPPPHGRGQNKVELWEMMHGDKIPADQKYKPAFWGDVLRDARAALHLNDLQDGDIIMLDFYDYPMRRSAAHYAVVDKGKIYQIINTPHPPGKLEVIDVQDWPKLFEVRTQTDIRGNIHKLKPYRFFDVYRKGGTR